MSWNTYLSTVTGNSITTNGVEIADSVACDSYKYYGFQIPSPCYDLNLLLSTVGGAVNGITELSVGTYPNNAPNGLKAMGYGKSIEWTSYDWGDQNLTISAFDPNLKSGHNCGLNKDQLCTLIIGVYAYCADASIPTLSFTLTPTLKRTYKSSSSQVGDFCVLNKTYSSPSLQPSLRPSKAEPSLRPSKAKIRRRMPTTHSPSRKPSPNHSTTHSPSRKPSPNHSRPNRKTNLN